MKWLSVSLLSVCADAEHSWKQNIILVFIADFIPTVSGHYIVKQHKLDAAISVNLICMKLKHKTADIIFAWI